MELHPAQRGARTDEVLASVFVASYWGGLTVGRFLLAFGGDRVAPEVIMSRASGLAVVAAAIFAADPGGLGGFALPLLGFAFSVMFPAVVNRTPIYLGADRAARIVGYQLATSSAGAIIVPAVIGLLADRTSQEALGWVSLVVVLMMAAMWAAVRATLRPGALLRRREHAGLRGDRDPSSPDDEIVAVEAVGHEAERDAGRRVGPADLTLRSTMTEGPLARVWP